MKINLYEQTEHDIATAVTLFKKLGWEQDGWDIVYLEDKNDVEVVTCDIVPIDHPHGVPYTEKRYKTKFTLALYPELLSFDYIYREGKSNDKISNESFLTPWVACKYTIFPDENPDRVISELKDYMLNTFPLRPFYDEDATGKIFTKKIGNDCIDIICYINPSFPNGWWQNHVL
mgnify:CR=1 FL=1